MPCNYNPATNEVETLFERYQRESEIDARIEAEHRADQARRMQQAMKAVDFVSKWKLPHPATYGIVRK